MEQWQSLYLGTSLEQQSTNQIMVNNGLVSSALEKHVNVWLTLIQVVMYSSLGCRLPN